MLRLELQAITKQACFSLQGCARETKKEHVVVWRALRISLSYEPVVLDKMCHVVFITVYENEAAEQGQAMLRGILKH
jgi:hypothetical protein